ncbi:MAG TPA: SET domain-containing protein [Rubricoccaceae bacterium]|nr:SET domain-containing protein [Rubricoccaceae bacterium]
MFLIPTYLAPSPIHGTGVFTPVPIKAGTILWRLDPSTDWEIPPEDFARFPEPYQSRLRAYAYQNFEGVYILCGDNARYMNHADDPNCDDSGQVITVARRDIAAGEELTCDYRLFDAESAGVGGALYAPVELARTG